MKRLWKAVLNAVLLLSLTPTIFGVLAELLLVGRVDLASSYFGLGILNLSLLGLVVWHMLVWERRIKIERSALYCR